MLGLLELFMLLFNFSTEDFLVEKGNRIVQIIFQKCEEVSFVEVETTDIVQETDLPYLKMEKSKFTDSNSGLLRGSIARVLAHQAYNFFS